MSTQQQQQPTSSFAAGPPINAPEPVPMESTTQEFYTTDVNNPNVLARGISGVDFEFLY